MKQPDGEQFAFSNKISNRNSQYTWQLAVDFKSVSPKTSRIGRQKRNNGFFLIWPKEPFWWTIFGNDIKRFDFLFLSSKFAKLENSATGPSVAAMKLEIWDMFNMHVWTYQTLSWDVLCTVFVASLKLYSGLNVVLKCFLLQDS